MVLLWHANIHDIKCLTQLEELFLVKYPVYALHVNGLIFYN